MKNAYGNHRDTDRSDRDSLVEAEFEVNHHARQLSEALEGLRWGLSRTSRRIDRFADRAGQPIAVIRRQPAYVSIPILLGAALAFFFGLRAYRRRQYDARYYESESLSLGESA